MQRYRRGSANVKNVNCNQHSHHYIPGSGPDVHGLDFTLTMQAPFKEKTQVWGKDSLLNREVLQIAVHSPAESWSGCAVY